MHPVLDRFRESVPRWALATNDLFKGLIQLPRAIALERAYIQPNAKKYLRYLIFDVDQMGAAFAHEERNLPNPTATLVNPKNTHAHLIYELTTPVSRGEFARGKPQRWLDEIRVRMTLALRADPGYASLIAKNPFSDRWGRILYDRTYELRYLAEALPALPKTKGRLRGEYAALGRNCATFEHTRLFAYGIVSRCTSVDSFEREVCQYARSVNDGGLPEKEITTISKSIARWTWAQRKNLDRGNAGIMGFPKMRGLSLAEFEAEKKRRQQESGRWTAKKKAEATDTKIVRAIAELRSTGRPATVRAIAAAAKVSPTAVQRSRKAIGMTLFDT